MPTTAPSEKRLPVNANLGNLRKRAKQLPKFVRTDARNALVRLQNNLSHTIHSSDFASITLSDAQRVIAREHSFASWPKLKSALESGRSDSASDELAVAPFEVPLVPLRDYIVYTGMEMPLYVGRSKLLSAIEAADLNQQIFLCLQQDGKKTFPISMTSSRLARW